MNEFKYNTYNYTLLYKLYITNTLKKILNEHPIKKHINCSAEHFILNNYNINIHLNIEHTIVKQGGRDIPNNTELSELKYDNKNYYIRIIDFSSWCNSDLVIEYSIPNIINVSYTKNDKLKNKQVYVPPLLFDVECEIGNRNIEILTTFIDTNQLRRRLLFDLFQNENINYININNCFTLEDNKKLLKNTKIIVNIHQTDHHDTFEELRCLPALLCGVIVISEYSPLLEYIPYKDYIIWSSFEDIPKKIKEISSNYEYYHSTIFNSSFNLMINNMKEKTKNDLANKLLEIDSN